MQDNNQKESFSSKFNTFYKKELSIYLQDFEKSRKKFLAGIIVFTIISTILLFWLIYSTKELGLISLGAIILILINSLSKRYKEKVKKKVLPKLLKFVGDFKISEDKNVFEYIKTLKLFNDFNSQSCDDRIKGKYKLLDIDIAEISLSKVTGSGKHRRVHYVFSGLLITVPCRKKFQGYTIIKYKGPQSLIKNISSGQGISLSCSFNNKFQGDIVNLEDPEFNKLYSVYSSDQIEARFLITTAFMSRLINIAKKGYGGYISVSFENGFVHLAVESSKDWFEVPILKRADNIANYKAIVFEMRELLKIIDSLKLEQNIGL